MSYPPPNPNQQYPPQQYPPQQYPPQQYPPQQYPPQQYPPQQYPPQQYPPQQYPPQQYPPQQYPPQQYPPQQYPPQQYPPQQQPQQYAPPPQQYPPQQHPQQQYAPPPQQYAPPPQQQYAPPPQQQYAPQQPVTYTPFTGDMSSHANSTAHLYMSYVAPAQPPYNPDVDVTTLHAAMKGLGTDDKTLSNIIATRSKPQLLTIKAAFQAKFGKTLENWIKGETSGHYEDLLIALIQEPAEYDAMLVRDAVKGLGTNDDQLVEAVCTRTNAQLKAMKAAYTRLYGKDLDKDVADDTSGDYRNLLLALLRADRPESQPVNLEEAKKDAQTLYNAGEGKIGTDEKVFVQILSQRSIPQLLTIAACYAQITGHSLEKGISKETSGNFKKAMIVLITPREEYFATQIRDAIDGAGTKDKKLVRVLGYLSDNNNTAMFRAVNAFYTHRWKNNLAKDVGGDTSGWYKKTAVSLIQNRCNI